jgi:hypothetical protein
VVLFKPLATAYSTELSNFLEKSQGLLTIKKSDFVPLFWKAWVSSFKETTILKSFEAMGIAPDVILKRFTSNHPDDEESRESSTSVLSASDWRKLDRLVKVSAKNSKSEESKKLIRSFHSISTHIQLLQHEVEGLGQALVVKKKQDARGKTLDLQQRKEYHGGAVIWSPSKVREARAHQVIKERDAEEKKQKKAERAEVRAANKLLKEKLDRQKQERRVEREGQGSQGEGQG